MLGSVGLKPNLLDSRSLLRAALASCGLVLCTAACYWTVRLAWIVHLSTIETTDTLARALRLAPGDADLWTKWASTVGEDEAAAGLRQSLALNPWNSSNWIALGLTAETRQD